MLVFSLFTGCRIYSFTGASISPEVKTISIKYFPNRAPLIQPVLSQFFTNALKDKFSRETNLSLIENNGDLNIEGEITGYATSPVAIQNNQVAALNRLTITVKVKFESKYNEAQNFETSFSRFQDYESSKSLSEVEETLMDQITQDLVQDIFNKAVVNW
jgi:hypothetical protein